MPLLDDLKKKVQDTQAKQEQEQDRVARLNAFYTTKMVPKLRKTYLYLKELKEHLNFINEDLLVSYDINNYGTLHNLKQCNYAISADSTEKMKVIRFGFSCKGNEPAVFDLKGATPVQAQSDYFHKFDVRFNCRYRKNDKFEIEAAEFTVDPHIRAQLTISADIENGRICMSFKNFDGLSVINKNFPPEDITDELLDAIGRFIIRQDDRVFKGNMSDIERERLMAQVREEQRIREEEIRKGLSPNKQPENMGFGETISKMFKKLKG